MMGERSQSQELPDVLGAKKEIATKASKPAADARQAPKARRRSESRDDLLPPAVAVLVAVDFAFSCHLVHPPANNPVLPS